MTENKFFPINTKTSCRLKWSWSSLFLNSGITTSCHRSSHCNIDLENFDNFHNTQEKILHRELMLKGEWPGHGCEYCRNIEDSGGISDRQFQNQIPGNYPSELDADPTLTNVDPTIVEVFFSNTCNLKCVYCRAELSSSIQQENNQFGGAIDPLTDHKYVDNRYRELVPKFWNWFKSNSTKLKRLQLLGGEPFLQSDVDQIFDYLEETPCPDLELNLITNLSIPSSLFSKKIEKLASLVKKKHLKRIDLLISIDSWGAGQDYVRYGLNRDLFEQNLRLAQASGIFKIGLLTTVNSLTINEMPELGSKFLEWNKLQSIEWYMHLVLPERTSIFNPLIFDYKNFEDSLTKLIDMLPTDTWDNQRTLEILNGINSKLKHQCKDDSNSQKKLFDHLDQIDRRRGLDWKNTFRWIKEKYVV